MVVEESCPQNCDCHSEGESMPGPRRPVGQGCGMCFCGGRTPESNKRNWEVNLKKALTVERRIIRANKRLEKCLRKKFVSS